MGPVLTTMFRLFDTCCQLPILEDIGQGAPEPTFSAGAFGLWAAFAGGVALLSLSLWSAVALAIRAI